MKKLKVSPLFFFVLLLSFFLNLHKKFLLSFFAVLFHELGHLLITKGKNIEISFVKIEPFGVTIKLKNSFIKNPYEEIIIALFGPLANFILAFFTYLFFGKRLIFFIFLNLSMGLFNLLPAYPLDGGRILRAHFSKKMGYLKSYQLVFRVTRIISMLVIIFGIYILVITKFNFSLCLIGAFLLFNLLCEKNHTYFYLMKEITEYKEKNRDIEKMPIKHIAVNKAFKIRKIFLDLSFNKYHIFLVVDKGKVISSFTEGELMEGLINYGGNAKISDLIYY